MERVAGKGQHDLATVLTLELLFRTEVEFVVNTARRCGLSEADAEDVAQMVFMALQRRLHTLHSPESVRPWLATVTRRHAAALAGANLRQSIEECSSELGEIEDEDAHLEEKLLASERRHELLEILEAIEPGRRTILAMHVLDELPVPEIADALRMPVATVYNRLRLARQDLRDVFARRHLSDEFGDLLRSWQKVLTVRDPGECFYGRPAITQDARERLWGHIVDGVRLAFGSLEEAEIHGLRVLSPLWRTNATPRPYGRLRPTRKLAKVPWGARVPAAPPAATGCRTP